MLNSTSIAMTTCIEKNNSLQLQRNQSVQNKMLESLDFIESYISAINLCKAEPCRICADDEEISCVSDRVPIDLRWLSQQINSLKHLSAKIAN